MKRTKLHFICGLLILSFFPACASYKISFLKQKIESTDVKPICSDETTAVRGIKVRVETINSRMSKLNLNGEVEILFRVGQTPVIPAYVPRALLSLQRDAVIMIEVFPFAPNIFSVALITYVTKNGKLDYSQTAFVNMAPCEDGEISLIDKSGNTTSAKIRIEFLS